MYIGRFNKSEQQRSLGSGKTPAGKQDKKATDIGTLSAVSPPYSTLLTKGGLLPILSVTDGIKRNQIIWFCFQMIKLIVEHENGSAGVYAVTHTHIIYIYILS